MRKYLVPLLAIGALAVPASAVAGDDPPAPVTLPSPPSAVTDNDTAGAFARLFVARNVRVIIQQGGAGNFDRRRVRTTAVDASCLQSPVLATRFGCVFTLRAAVILRRSHGWDDWGNSASAASTRGGHQRNRRFRVRNIGCLGFLRINGGPSVTPTAQVLNVECARIPRDDTTVVEPTSDDS